MNDYIFLTHLQLANYRSWQRLDLPVSSGINVFFGRNGVGKTNILESIHFIGLGDSHRINGYKGLIRIGCDHAEISATLQQQAHNKSLHYQAQFTDTKPPKILINGVDQKKQYSSQLFPLVLFSPEDLLLLRGDPSQRRKLFDYLALGAKPQTWALKTEYERIVKQRTSLLKSLPAHKSLPTTAVDSLSVWNSKLIEVGAQIVQIRIKFLKIFEPIFQDIYLKIAPHSAKPGCSYCSSWGIQAEELENVTDEVALDIIKNRFSEQLAVKQEEELIRGITLVGPHRDDIAINLGQHLAKITASHGELWSLALSIKLAQRTLAAAHGYAPVLLLDDVFAELDDGRKEFLGSYIAHDHQVFITSANFSDLPPILTRGNNVEIAADYQDNQENILTSYQT